MSEHDLGLKVGTRRLLWSMGFSTRLDVVLRGDGRQTALKTSRAKQTRSTGPETFTDLDVLGVVVSPGYRLTTAVADCKTGSRDKPTARMFWARGVADLFGADQILLVREREVNDATRQLSSRLGITVLTSKDLFAMQQLHGDPVPNPDGPLKVLFDRELVERAMRAFDKLDRRLNSLLEYRNFDYWVYDQHRNPFQLVAHLRDARGHLDPSNPDHLALFMDMAWLYLYSLIGVTEHLRGAFMQDMDRGLQEYLFGGATGLNEKREFAAVLESVRPKEAKAVDHLPPYYANLREVVIRLLRRPGHVQGALRFAEAASALMSARTRVTLRDAFGTEFDPLTAKLVADVCGFLVASAELDPEFRTQTRAWLLAEPVNSGGTGARADPVTDHPTESVRSQDSAQPVRPGQLSPEGEIVPDGGPYQEESPSQEDEPVQANLPTLADHDTPVSASRVTGQGAAAQQATAKQPTNAAGSARGISATEDAGASDARQVNEQTELDLSD